VDPEDKFMT